MPFAVNGQISQTALPGGIRITPQQYAEGLQAMLSGRAITIEGGFAVIDPPAPGEPEPEPPPETIQAALAQRFATLDAKRRAVEEGGIIFGGMPLKTDRQTAAIITAAYVKALADPNFVIPNWKFMDGVFGPLDAATVVAAGDAITAHVQSAFDLEAALSARLQALPDIASVMAFDIDAEWEALQT